MKYYGVSPHGWLIHFNPWSLSTALSLFLNLNFKHDFNLMLHYYCALSRNPHFTEHLTWKKLSVSYLIKIIDLNGDTVVCHTKTSTKLLILSKILYIASRVLRGILSLYFNEDRKKA